MIRLKLILATAMVVGLSFALAGSALAATASCGQCHGAYVNDNHGGKTLMPGVSTLEDTKTPQAGDICNNNGRGLHGVHMNYSSVSYGKTGTTRGNCNYCHNAHVHENGFVEMSGYSPASAMGVPTAALASGGTGYVVGDILTISGGDGNAMTTVKTVSSGVITALNSFKPKGTAYSVANGVALNGGTGTGATVNITAITSSGLRQSVSSAGKVVVTGTGMTANGLDIVQMTGVANCTSACHKGTSVANPASWNNYTSASIKLSCVSCHDDGTNGAAGLSSPSGKGHNEHLNGGWLGSGANKTKIVMGSYSGYLNSGDNSACQFCHPDNRNDLWSQGRADDGSKKAYPHATDGTNVVATNAALGGAAGVATSDRTLGFNFTCTASCHVQRSSYQTAYARWDGTKPASGTFSNCEICHQHKSSAAINNSSNVPLSYAHSIHFANLSTSAGLASCGTCHLGAHTNYAGNAMITRLPVTPGYAGLLATMNWSRAGVAAVDGTCKNSCHISASPAWNTIGTGSIVSITGCATCHSYPGVTGRDWTGANGHTMRASTFQDTTTAVIRKSIKHLNVATAYNATADSYAGVTGNVRLCGKCHAGASTNHMNSTVNVADSSGVGTACSTSFTYNNVSSNPTNRIVNCSNVSCHFGKTTPNWF